MIDRNVLKWEVVTLGLICDIYTGKYDANHAVSSGKYRFYTCAFEHMFCNTNRFKGESIIIPGNGANVGEVFYYNGEFDAYQRTYVLRNFKIHSKYLYYHLRFKWRSVNSDKQFGSATNYIRMGNFTDYIFPLPPLAEQQRIVEKIEELFSGLDKGVETLKSAKQQLKVYRQAVLKYAFEGKYTNPDVKEGELPEGWTKMALAEIGSWRGGGTPSKSNLSYWQNGTIDWISAKDVKSDIISNVLDKITLEALNDSSAKMIPANSVLIVMRSGILRRTLPISLVQHEVAINQDLQALTPFETNSLYLLYCLKAFSEAIRKVCSKDGTTVESIDSTSLKRFQIPVAPILIQNMIVQEIESRLSVCDKIEESIEQGLQQAEALRQSILKKAFEGKLVPQDPNDEPASVLLERIKAERAAAQPVNKTKTKKILR